MENEVPPPIKRGRGRPRKHPPPLAPLPAETPIPSNPVELIVPEVLAPIKRGRGRPRKHPLPVLPEAPLQEVKIHKPSTVKKTVKVYDKEIDFYVISYDDLVFWAHNANRPLFTDALAAYQNANKKKNVSLEIRWYWDRIDIVNTPVVNGSVK